MARTTAAKAKTPSTPPAEPTQLFKLQYEDATYLYDPDKVRIPEATFVETIAGQAWAFVLASYNDRTIRAATLCALAAVIVGRSDSRSIGELYDKIAEGELGQIDLTVTTEEAELGPTEPAAAAKTDEPPSSSRTSASGTSGSTN